MNLILLGYCYVRLIASRMSYQATLNQLQELGLRPGLVELFRLVYEQAGEECFLFQLALQRDQVITVRAVSSLP